MKNLTDFYQQFNPRIRSRVPTVTVQRTLIGDNLKHSIPESLAAITFSSFKREPEVKKKKLRKKSGKKGGEVKDHPQPPIELTELTSSMKPVTSNLSCLKNEGWSKVREVDQTIFLLFRKSMTFYINAFQTGGQTKEAKQVSESRNSSSRIESKFISFQNSNPR